jgi:hypothetical protein
VARSYPEETYRFVLDTFLRRFDMTAQSPPSPAMLTCPKKKGFDEKESPDVG